MRAVLIDAYRQVVEPIELSENVAEYSGQINKALKSATHLYTTSTDGQIQIIVDDNCLIKHEAAGFFCLVFPTVLFGNVLLIGRDPLTGNKVDVDSSINGLSLSVEFLSKEQTDIARKDFLNYGRELNEGNQG